MTATPRHAATLIVLDEREPVPRVLMGRRSATARFMPSHDVFPGGAVDPEDHHAATASPISALTLAHLSRGAEAGLAAALAVAAARELHEETGLSLGQPPRLAGLRYLCRAITPPDRPIRFDARFLVIDHSELEADSLGIPLLEGGELAGLAWHRLDTMHALTLARPTRYALTLLAARLSGSQPWPTDPAAPLPILLDAGGGGEE